jgi:hypothetical protein
MAFPARGNRKKRKMRSAIRRYWWLAPVLCGIGALFWLATGPRWFGPRVLTASGAPPIKGYIYTIDTVQQEYLHFHGRRMKNPEEVERLFKMANQQVGQQDYNSAVLLLESITKEAAVPVIFNNLGVLYAQLNDRSRAINAFREALSRDIDYQPVRLNLDRLGALGGHEADPVTREIEPNNSARMANIISLNTPVDGEIAADVGDLDFFRFTSPPAPRDILVITIEPKSPRLTPALHLWDEDERVTRLGLEGKRRGAPIRFVFAPQPSTTFNIQVFGANDTAGMYTLKVTPQRAFDNYEPNDDIYNARRIEAGHDIQANIMDSDDYDFFSFLAPHTGPVYVTIVNHSTTLVPALQVFAPDKRTMGFGPDVHTPGANLRHSFDVVEGQTYYLQVWTSVNSAGQYSLIVE